MKGTSITTKLVFYLFAFVFGLVSAQDEVSYYVEGNPVITLNGQTPTQLGSSASPILLTSGEELCYPKAQSDTERVWLVYPNGDRMPLEASLETCFAVPEPSFWSVFLSIFNLNSNNAVIVQGRGEVRGSTDESVDIVLPSPVLSDVTLWVKGGPGPFVLRLGDAEMIEPSQVIDGAVRDEVAFTLSAQALQQATRVEIFKGDGSLFYCGKVIVSSDIETSTSDLMEEARVLSLNNDWQLMPVMYSYLTTALESGQVDAEARGDFEQMLTGMRQFMMETYSVDSCKSD